MSSVGKPTVDIGSPVSVESRVSLSFWSFHIHDDRADPHCYIFSKGLEDQRDPD